MRPTVIRKSVANLRPPPNLVDYDAARRGFSWDAVRAELTGRLRTALAPPEREPMQAAVTSCRQEGDLIVEEVAFLWAERAYVSGTVIRRQQAAGRQAAVIVTPGWLGHYTFRAYRRFVDALARQGMLVLFIDDPRAGRWSGRAKTECGLHT